MQVVSCWVGWGPGQMAAHTPCYESVFLLWATSAVPSLALLVYNLENWTRSRLISATDRQPKKNDAVKTLSSVKHQGHSPLRVWMTQEDKPPLDPDANAHKVFCARNDVVLIPLGIIL